MGCQRGGVSYAHYHKFIKVLCGAETFGADTQNLAEDAKLIAFQYVILQPFLDGESCPFHFPLSRPLKN